VRGAPPAVLGARAAGRRPFAGTARDAPAAAAAAGAQGWFWTVRPGVP